MFAKVLSAGAVALVALTSVVAVSAADARPYANVATAPVAVAASLTPVTSEEAASLQFMREEEKLAHDVYVTLYEQWGTAVFANIAQSEQTHTDRILGLLDRYGVADPAAGNAVGEFSDPDLQALYDQLALRGSESLAEALKVGAVIEEIDILDLQERIAETSHYDIAQVYRNLMSGSENHLRAFTRSLQAVTGEAYVPQVLDQAAYDAIAAGAAGQGGAAGRRGGRRS